MDQLTGLNCSQGLLNGDASDQLDSSVVNQRLINPQRNFEAYYQVLSLMPFQDDDPIGKYTPSFDLESHLTLCIQAEMPSLNIDPQSIPIKVTLALSPMEVPSRPPLDIVCVIEKSQFMTSSFLNIIRASIENLLNGLDDNDRVSVVLYDDFGYRTTPLSRMNEESKKMIKEGLHEVYPSGGVDMADGVGQAMEVLRQRKYLNPSTCILVMGASNDLKSMSTLDFLLEKYANEKFYIHAFGCMEGDDNILQWIANRKNGGYYKIEGEKELTNSIFNALTSLAQIQCHEAEIYFFSNTKIYLQDQLLEKYQDNVSWSIPEKCFKVRISYLTQGSKEDFHFEIAYPCLDKLSKSKENEQHLVDLVDVIYRIETLDNVIMKKESLQASIYQEENEEILAEQEQGDDHDGMTVEECRPQCTKTQGVFSNSLASIDKVNKLIIVEELMLEANKLLHYNQIDEAKKVANRIRREAQGLGMEFEMVIRSFLERVYQKSQEGNYEYLIEAR